MRRPALSTVSKFVDGTSAASVSSCALTWSVGATALVCDLGWLINPHRFPDLTYVYWPVRA
jgi:hypothetical protein